MRWAILGLLVTACGTPETSPPPVRRPDVPVQRALPAGTVLGLRGTQTVLAGELEEGFVDGLMRLAMVQSPHFDVAAQDEGAPSHVEITVQADPQARILTTTLHEEGQVPIPLAHASYREGDLPSAVDSLAFATRQALGEDLDAAPAPMPSGLAYSTQARCVEDTEQALDRLREGDLTGAERLLLRARRLDGGSPVVLDAFARLLAVKGQPERAALTANEGLRYGNRLAPTSRHRLARTQLQAEASLEAPRAIQRQDLELLTLAEATLRERPHDPQALYSKALALNFLSRFEESAPLFRRLRQRLPRNATVAYHQAFAELATGHYEEALSAIVATHAVLPRQVTAVPHALALFHADRPEELRIFLEELATLPSAPGDYTQHEVLRMQAAHAILTNRREDAINLLVEDMEWMRQRPSMLEMLTLTLVEDGEVLLRLGAVTELRRMIVGLQQLNHSSPTFAQGMVYLGGLLEIAQTGGRATAAEATLDREDNQFWGSSLRAMGFRWRGELMEEAKALAEASQYSDSALIRVSLAMAWRTMGRQEEAEVLLSELKEKLLTIRLRLPLPHPLLNPARALAYLAVE